MKKILFIIFIIGVAVLCNFKYPINREEKQITQEKKAENNIQAEQNLGGTGTLGYTSVGGTQTTQIAINTIRGWIYTMPENGTVTKISFYTKVGIGKTALIRPTIYLAGDNSLIAYGDEVQVTNTTFAWVDLPISAILISGNAYKIGIWIGGADSTNAPYYDYAAGLTMYRDDYAYHATNPPVNPFVDDATLADRKASIYATYTTIDSPAVIDPPQIILFE